MMTINDLVIPPENEIPPLKMIIEFTNQLFPMAECELIFATLLNKYSHIKCIYKHVM